MIIELKHLLILGMADLSFFSFLFLQVHVQVSLSHGEEYSRVHSPAALWI